MNERILKESFYNNYVQTRDYTLLYNSLYNNYMILKIDKYNQLKQNTNALENLKESSPKFYDLLLKNKFIIDNNLDEREIYRNERIKQKFNTNQYEVTINPTLDCNLNCWYCYENHKDGSYMSQETQNKIIKHLELKYQENNFRDLLISFFGGEPLLEFKRVIIPLTSRIRQFTKKNKIHLRYMFTTNGTLISDSFVKEFYKQDTSFQITFDGYNEVHNNVRHFKKSHKGTYQLILNNIDKIISSFKNYSIIVRLNFDSKTLSDAKLFLDDLARYNTDHIVVNLQKVWQVDDKVISNNEILDLIEYSFKKGIIIQYKELIPTYSTCYADNYNQVVINYDGLIYKCTAADFNRANSEGVLEEDGKITWNTTKLCKRLNFNIPPICENCKLAPSCKGLCSQKLITNNLKCIYKNESSKNDSIIQSLNANILCDKFLKDK